MGSSRTRWLRGRWAERARSYSCRMPQQAASSRAGTALHGCHLAEQLTVPTFTVGLRGDVHPDEIPDGAVTLTRNMSLWKGDLGVVPGFEQLTPGNVLVGTEFLPFAENRLEAGRRYLVTV